MSSRTTRSTRHATACHHVFCYGSLRPDDDSGMPWTKDAVAGMKAQPATVAGAKLYQDDYAALVFDDNDTDEKYWKNNHHGGVINANTTTSNYNVVGWVLTAEPTSVFQRKLQQFDTIEGYNRNNPRGSFYQRAIAQVRLGDPKHAVGGEEALAPEGTVVHAYVYHKPNCKKQHPIPSGDWLQR